MVYCYAKKSEKVMFEAECPGCHARFWGWSEAEVKEKYEKHICMIGVKYRREIDEILDRVLSESTRNIKEDLKRVREENNG